MLDVALRGRRGEFRLDVQFRAPTPGVTALFGVSGSGKSTLARALCGLLPGVEGSIVVDDEVWLDSGRGLCTAPEARGVGAVFQEPRLFPHLSVAGNLDYAAARSRHRTPIVKRQDVIELLGLGALLARRVQGLSGGERSRVALGRALLGQPRLLLLDEPLANLDGARREEILPFLEDLRDRYRLPMVYVSHEYDEVLRLAAHVVLLDAGRALASGSPSALSLDPILVRQVGRDRAGAVVEGPVTDASAGDGLATIALGAGRLRLPAGGLRAGDRARVLVPARDVLIATSEPHGLSVRNQLRGTVTALRRDTPGAVLVTVDIGGQSLLARLTGAAVTELGLVAGQPVHALVKAESLRGHAYRRGT